MTNSPRHCSSASLIRLRLAALALGVALVAGVAQAQTFTLLYSFTGLSDGAFPYAGLIRDGAGSLYGTTSAGGGASGNGTVFKLDITGNLIVLHCFTSGADGAYPYAGLIRDAAGNLYGTTHSGGLHDAGTVFKVHVGTGTEKVLYSFTGGPGGAFPYAGVIRDAAGNLYGTTSAGGGASGNGTVFQVDATGRGKVLHSFTGVADGVSPYAGLIHDATGNFYGTTYLGGDYGNGTVFQVDATGKESLLYSFTGGSDSAYANFGSLVRDATNNLYGTAGGGYFGWGTVFKLDTSGIETVLHNFTGGADGGAPLAGLIPDAAGNLYGTTSAGGGASGSGTVFKLDITGKLTVLHSFTYTDGAYPVASLIRDAAGNLYGTTVYGGAYGVGTVFKLTP